MMGGIVICGAGNAGLATALALARQGQRPVILAPRRPVPPPQTDLYHARVYAISPASQAFLQELGVWDALEPGRVAPVAGMEIHGDADGRLDLHAWQAARDALAWIVESSEIERALQQAVRVFGLEWRDEEAVRYDAGVLFTSKGAELRPDLLIGADGARSRLRAHVGGVSSRAYGATGLVAHLDAELPHGGIARQWFRDDGVLALLPLPDTAQGPQVSMVWSMRDEHAQAMKALPAEEAAHAWERRLAQATEGALGRLSLRSAVHGFPLTLDRTDMVGERLALVGDAAHRVHPLAGQGLNLGLGDARELAAIVGGREDFRLAGDPLLLRRYRRRRAEAVGAMALATDGLHRLFEAQPAPLAWLRNTGMSLIGRLPGLQRLLIEQASR